MLERGSIALLVLVGCAGASRQRPPAEWKDPDPALLDQFAATWRFNLGKPSAFAPSPDGKTVLFLRSGPRSFVRELWELDLAFADDEARVQPAVRLSFRRELDAREDCAVGSGCALLDALAVHRDEQLAALARGDHPAEVRGPHAVLPPSRVVRPHHLALDLAADLTVAVTETETLPVAVRVMPAAFHVPHRQRAQRFDREHFVRAMRRILIEKRPDLAPLITHEAGQSELIA